MIDFTLEQPISLAAAAKLVPPARNGKRTHISTLVRWILTGAKALDGTRVRLEALRVGGRWMTSRQALQRFAERLTPCLDGGGSTPEVRPATHWQKASEKAASELKKHGI